MWIEKSFYQIHPNHVIKFFEAIGPMCLSKYKMLTSMLYVFNKYLFLDHVNFMEYDLSRSVDLGYTLFS